MQTVTLEEARAKLPELIEQLHGGDSTIITRDNRPVARLIAEAGGERPARKLGTLRGTVRYMAPDFDAPLEDFREYMG